MSKKENGFNIFTTREEVKKFLEQNVAEELRVYMPYDEILDNWGNKAELRGLFEGDAYLSLTKFLPKAFVALVNNLTKEINHDKTKR